MRTLLLPLFFFTILSSSQNLKSPSEFLGYELGTQFTRHHQVVDYYQYLAQAEPERVKLQEYGKTNERRPLLLATVSSAENIRNLENIRLEHLKGIRGEGDPATAIVWLSYNVHGNESVSTEASMQTIYDLLTLKSEYLRNTVVLMDPCINPDGRDRYVNWYNENKNTPNNLDPNSMEHNEGWLSGRANHYMFDLNRDWAWLTQVESQQRLKIFNQWLPLVHVDFHEQGVDSPYYFAPAAEPFHEVITPFQREFQKTIGKNHAKYFDANGWFYFTKEVFDLFYPSYGDTYPMYNGGIGMTYEQGGGGDAGLGVITGIGDTLTLKNRIAHHLTTGLSTVEVASANAEKLNTEFKKFHRNKDFKYKSYVLSGDPDKITALTHLLDQHQIEYGTSMGGAVKGFDYKTGKITTQRSTENNLVISSDQPKGTLVKVLFEPNAKLSDSLTYDITAWSLPYAYGLDAIASEVKIGGTDYVNHEDTGTKIIDENAYAYITDWKSMEDARFLAELLTKNIRVRFAQKPFKTEQGTFERGSLIITKSDNKNKKDYQSILQAAVQKHHKNLIETGTGFVESGKDFGSRYVEVIKDVKIAVLRGGPTSSLQFGEIWHFFEQQLHYPTTIIDAEYWTNVDLSEYDVLILPSGGNYKGFFKEKHLDELKEWVNNGGKLIAMDGAIQGIDGDKGFDIKIRKNEKDTIAIKEVEDYGSSEREGMKESITGAIFKTHVDNTHPLAYGYGDTYFTLKLGEDTYEYLKEGTVVYLENDTKPFAGFAGSEIQKRIAQTLVFGVENHGSGQVIYMVDNPLFRGFWENGKLFFANAIFMVN